MRNACIAAARCLALLLLPVFLLPAAPKKAVATARGENEDLVLTVTLYIDPAGVKELIGSDLDGHYIVADVKVQPKYGKEISIDRDDFQLRTDKDGEKTTPFAPSQIAGSGGMVLKQAPIRRSSPGVTLGGRPLRRPYRPLHRRRGSHRGSRRGSRQGIRRGSHRRG